MTLFIDIIEDHDVFVNVYSFIELELNAIGNYQQVPLHFIQSYWTNLVG